MNDRCDQDGTSPIGLSSDGRPARAERQARRPPSRKDVLGLAAVGLGLTFGRTASAQPSGHGVTQPGSGEPARALSQEERWRRRFPQPVLVSDLIGRRVLDTGQGVLGHIETLVRTNEGEILIAFARRRLFLFRGETVAVPAKVAALLGPFVMILDLSAAEIDGLRPFSVTGTTAVDRASRIEMALTKH